LRRRAGGDERSAAARGLHDHGAEGEAGDDSVARRKVAGQRRSAGRELGDDETFALDAAKEPAVRLRIDDVDAGADDGDGGADRRTDCESTPPGAGRCSTVLRENGWARERRRRADRTAPSAGGFDWGKETEEATMRSASRVIVVSSRSRCRRRHDMRGASNGS